MSVFFGVNIAAWGVEEGVPVILRGLIAVQGRQSACTLFGLADDSRVLSQSLRQTLIRKREIPTFSSAQRLGPAAQAPSPSPCVDF